MGSGSFVILSGLTTADWMGNRLAAGWRLSASESIHIAALGMESESFIMEDDIDIIVSLMIMKMCPLSINSMASEACGLMLQTLNVVLMVATCLNPRLIL